ncbi:MAG: phytoene desaturase family protein [Desulfocucumaceae bacterium]
MAERSVVIIGAGLAGLSTGCYCRMNGYHTRIFEHHSVPGGVAAAWKRDGYTIDGGVHFLMDHKPGRPTYQIYRELGAAQDSHFPDLNTYMRFVDQPSGRSFSIGQDLDRLAAGLKSLFPGNTREIECLVGGALAMQKSGMDSSGFASPPELAGRFDRIKQLWEMRKVFKYFGGRYSKTAADFAKTMADPFLGRLIQYLFLPEAPVWFLMMMLAMHGQGRLGLLEGGSLDFALSIERRYRELGGEITYRAAVEEILVENGRATGVRLADGSRHRADLVVSAADGHSTIFGLLGGRYLDDKIRRRYSGWKLCRPLIMASFGVNREFPDDPPMTAVFLERPLEINRQSQECMLVRIFNYSDKFAPPGKTVVQAEIETEWDYWNNLRREDLSRYRAEKERVAGELLDRLETAYPGITQQVEVTDVATPYTTWRYTRNHRGAYMGWLFTPEALMTVMERTLPGLDNFYMAGQWVAGGSVPGCLYSGRHVAQILCRREGRPFVARD